MGTCCSSQQIHTQENLFDEISQIEQINSEGSKQLCKPQNIMNFQNRNTNQQEHIQLPLKENYEHLKHISIITQQEMQDKDFLELMRQQKQFEELDRGAIRFSHSCRSTGSYFNVTKNRKKKSRSRCKGGSVGMHNNKKRGQIEKNMLFIITNQQNRPLTAPKNLQLFSHNMNQDFSYSPKSILKNPSAKKIELPFQTQRHVSFRKIL